MSIVPYDKLKGVPVGHFYLEVEYEVQDVDSSFLFIENVLYTSPSEEELINYCKENKLTCHDKNIRFAEYPNHNIGQREE